MPHPAIATEAAEALRDGEPFKRGNTEVQGGTLLLHGNPIAWIHQRDPLILYVSACGHPSRVTAGRIDAVLEALEVPLTCRLRQSRIMLGRRSTWNRNRIYAADYLSRRQVACVDQRGAIAMERNL